MRFSLSSLFRESPFEKLQGHADIVKECANLFKEASVCHIGQDCMEFELLTEKVATLESDADTLGNLTSVGGANVEANNAVIVSFVNQNLGVADSFSLGSHLVVGPL